MKILDLNIIDPRDTGAHMDPWIELKVDEEVEETDDPRYPPRLEHQWRMIPCGPFVSVEYYRNGSWNDTVDLGTFNTLNFARDQLIEVRPVWESGHDNVAMGVPRVRRLIRKHAPDWHIIVNETAAMRGRVLWRVERIKPRCIGLDHGLHCTVAPVTTVWYGGAHVNLCKHHLAHHNNRVRDLRKSS